MFPNSRLSLEPVQGFCHGIAKGGTILCWLNSVPNLFVISSIIFPCMYVGLFLRDECERSVKNQVSKDELGKFATSLRVAR